MTEKQQAIAAAAVGAVAGGIAGYMLFTDGGRTLRRRLEPAIEDFAHELMQLRGTVSRAAGVASEGWSVLNAALGEHGERSGPRYPAHNQTAPF